MGISGLILGIALATAAPGDHTYDTYDPSTTTGSAEAQLAEMVELYRAVCLKRFPDESAAIAEIKRRGGTPLAAAQVSIFLHDDPGAGWIIQGKTALFYVTIEYPAYHSCGVRSTARENFSDLVPYRTVIEEHEADWVRIGKTPSQTRSSEGVRTTGSAEATVRPDGSIETLFLMSATIEDPALRAKRPGIEVRFVRQIVAPASDKAI